MTKRRLTSKWLSGLLAAILPLSALPVGAAAAGSGFVDVNPGVWYAGAVSYVYENALMSGVTSSVFAPEDTMSRAMLATVLYRMAGSPELSGAIPFDDVEADAWYTAAVQWAGVEGYMEGYGNGQFGVSDPVTREQIAAILWRYAGSPSVQSEADYTDAQSISEWASDAADWASEAEIISGKPGNYFAPAEEATRAEAAVILTRYDQSVLTDPTPEVTPTPGATPEVTPTPEATPEVTPTPEATPEVTPTPEATPEVTPTPEATPEVTPTPEATPEVTPTPESTPEEELPTITPEPTSMPVPANPYKDEYFTINEDGFLYYEEEGVPCYVGIDVSTYQKEIDWDKVAAAGVDFALIRVGFRGYGKAGNIVMDNRFKYNIENALRVGIDVGVYFFSQAINEEEAIEEAYQTLEWIKGYDVTYPIVFDWEYISDSSSRTYNMTNDEIIACTKAFCEVIKAAGYRAMTYGNPSMVNSGYDLSQLLNYPFWLAHYTYQWTPTGFPYYSTMWQYSCTGRVDGIEGDVDLNICMADLKMW